MTCDEHLKLVLCLDVVCGCIKNMASVHWHNAKKIFDEERTNILECVSPSEKVTRTRTRAHTALMHMHSIARTRQRSGQQGHPRLWTPDVRP